MPVTLESSFGLGPRSAPARCGLKAGPRPAD